MRPVLGEAAALASAIFWGVGSVLLKRPSQRLGAFYISAVRMSVIGLLAVACVAAAGQFGAILHVSLKTFLEILFSAVVVALGDTALYRAFGMGDLSRIFTINTGLYVLFSVLASALFLHEAITPRVVCGGVLVVLGIALISERQRAVSGQPSKGVPLMVLALLVFTSATWAASLVALNHAMKNVDTLPGAAIRMPLMALTILPVALLRGDVKRHKLGGPDKLALVASGVCGAGSSLLWLAAIKYADASIAAILNSTAPVFVLMMTTAFLHERPTRRSLTGTVICMAGIVLTV